MAAPRLMRDQHDDGAARLEVDRSPGARPSPSLSIGIRLVEHNEKGVAKERARQSVRCRCPPESVLLRRSRCHSRSAAGGSLCVPAAGTHAAQHRHPA